MLLTIHMGQIFHSNEIPYFVYCTLEEFATVFLNTNIYNVRVSGFCVHKQKHSRDITKFKGPPSTTKGSQGGTKE